MSANTGVTRGQVVHGARAYITVDGRPAGYAQGVSAGISYDQVPIDVLDDLETVEHVTTAYRVDSLSAEFVALVKQSLIDAGIRPEQADALNSRTLTLEIKDRPQDQPLMVFEGVKFRSENFSVRKGQVTSRQVSFVALRMRDYRGRV